MPATTRLGLPYPDDDDPIAQGFSNIQQLAAKVESTLVSEYRASGDSPALYAQGTSMMLLTTAQAIAGAWPYQTSSQVLTVRSGTDRAAQYWFRNSSVTCIVLYRSGSGDVWTPWSYVAGPGMPNATAIGEVSFPNNSGPQSKTVTFPAGRFTETPIVVVSGSNRDAVYCSSGASASGFSANVDLIAGNANTDRTLRYHAIQMGPVF